MINPGNTGPGRNVFTNREREMAVYDALPGELRRVFQEGCRNYSVIAYGEALIKGAPTRAVVSFARRADAEERGDGIIRVEVRPC